MKSFDENGQLHHSQKNEWRNFFIVFCNTEVAELIISEEQIKAGYDDISRKTHLGRNHYSVDIVVDFHHFGGLMGRNEEEDITDAQEGKENKEGLQRFSEKKEMIIYTKFEKHYSMVHALQMRTHKFVLCMNIEVGYIIALIAVEFYVNIWKNN